MKTKTRVTAGHITLNHNQNGLPVKTIVKAAALNFNHNQAR
jgi:hypothetical protein